jgi:hypothetical protein
MTFDLDVRTSMVWKRLGVPMGDAAAELKREFEAAYGRAREALEPRHASRRVAVTSAEDGVLTLEGGVAFESAALARLAEGAAAVVAMAATVGGGVDDVAGDYNVRGDVFMMMVADAVGSVAAEELMARVHAAARAAAEAAGEVMTRRVSPGYGDFDLAYQPRLLELSGGAALGISLTENFMMVPRKSVTAVAAAKKK